MYNGQIMHVKQDICKYESACMVAIQQSHVSKQGQGQTSGSLL